MWCWGGRNRLSGWNKMRLLKMQSRRSRLSRQNRSRLQRSRLSRQNRSKLHRSRLNRQNRSSLYRSRLSRSRLNWENRNRW